MKAKEKATFAAPITNRGKDSKKSRMAKIKALFLRGGKYTAKQLNEISGGNYARKGISVLRRAGMDIQDIRLPDGCKLYWLNIQDFRQLSFWGRWEGVNYD